MMTAQDPANQVPTMEPLHIEISDQAKAIAEEKKTIANQYFGERKYDHSIEYYCEAIALNPTVATYYANRAFAYIRTEAFGYAMADANKAIELDPTYLKGYYRRAAANMALLNFHEALKDLRRVAKQAPQDRDAQRKCTECEKVVKRINFEKAIECNDEQISVVERIDLDTMQVDGSYDGMWIGENGEITAEWVMDMIDRFKKQKTIPKRYAFQVVLAARKLFIDYPSMVDVAVAKGRNLTVCGDVHGQFYDLMHIFKLNGFPSAENMFLFNGDFVDRGSFSVEVVLTLFALKVAYPDSLFLARGNHESLAMNQVYGFEGECKSKFSDLLFKLFTETFNALPVAHLIGGKILAVHGGLFAEDNVTLDDIRNIKRFEQPGKDGLLCDILWSDPQDEPGRAPSKRGVGIQFGPDVTRAFCKQNNLDMVIRSHEAKQEGYHIQHNGQCVTVFSAPNYCDSMGNKGAVVKIDHEMNVRYEQFDAQPHPDVKPMQYAGLNQFGGGLF